MNERDPLGDVTITPDPLGRGAVIARADTQHAVLTSPTTALAWIREGELQARLHGVAAVDDPGAVGATHWHDRNWTWALDYYLWSRRSQFSDRDDPRRADEVLESYLQQSGPPPMPSATAATRTTLPAPADLPTTSFRDVLLRRATVRTFSGEPLPADLLSALLWGGLEPVRRAREAAQATADPLISYGVAFDFALLIYRVAGVAPGAYWYDPLSNAVTHFRNGSFDAEFDAIVWGQGPARTAAFSLVLVADFPRYQWRYRHERGLRNLYVDAGRVVHPLLLVAAAHGLGAFMTPATSDSALLSLLDLPLGDRAPIYTVTIGARGKTAR